MFSRSSAALAAGIASAACLAAILAPHAISQGASTSPILPSGALQQKAQKACLSCHDAKIILQQQLDKKMWTKEMDKMIRWGAPVAPEDRGPLIDYFADHFAPRDPEVIAAMLPPGNGKEKVLETCFECHDAKDIVQKQLDERGWERILEKMEDLGAYIYDDDREDIIRYLAKAFPTPPKSAPPAKQPSKYP
jgi:mono/diheme cytochrome c family protein